MTSNISIIIPTMNRNETLKETISSLVSSQVLPLELIIVDQSNTPGMAEDIQNCLKNLPFAVKYTHLEKPSLTIARNVGAEMASGNVLVCMDDDVTVPQKVLGNIEKIFSDEKVAIIAGFDLNSGTGGTPQAKLGYLFLRKSRSQEFKGYVTAGLYGHITQQFEQTTDTDWAMGFFFVIRKDLLKKWNIQWDERLISYAYAEDLDFSWRYCQKAHKDDMKCLISRDVAIYHRVSQEWRETKRAFTFMEIFHREYISYKWGKSFWCRLGIRWANIGTFLMRLVKHDHPLDVLKAQFYCDWYRRDIKKGNLHTELFNK